MTFSVCLLSHVEPCLSTTLFYHVYTTSHLPSIISKPRAMSATWPLISPWLLLSHIWSHIHPHKASSMCSTYPHLRASSWFRWPWSRSNISILASRATHLPFLLQARHTE